MNTRCKLHACSRSHLTTGCGNANLTSTAASPRDRLSRFLTFARREESTRVKERSLGGWEKRVLYWSVLGSASASPAIVSIILAERSYDPPNIKFIRTFPFNPRLPLACPARCSSTLCCGAGAPPVRKFLPERAKKSSKRVTLTDGLSYASVVPRATNTNSSV